MRAHNHVVSRSRARYRGAVFIYATLIMIALCAIVSLAADLGHVQLVKSELRRACDAAAMYGVKGVNDGTAVAKAQAVAAQNTVDGANLSLAASEISTGTWASSTSTFTATASSPDTLRVQAVRTVPLMFAAAIGKGTCYVRATSIASLKVKGYGVVGLNYINMTGNSSDSYWSPSGYTSGGANGAIASNGNISLGGNSQIHGDARPGSGKSVNAPSKVTGSTAPLTTPLSYPIATAGTYATVNDNAQIPSNISSNTGGTNLSVGNKNATLPAGTYYVHDFTMSSSGSLTFSGPTVLYVYGDVSVGGSFVTNGDLPKNLKIYMVRNGASPAGSVSIGGSAALYADIYAPESAITLSGSGDIYGSVVGLSIDMTGTSGIHYDTSLNGTTVISLVQ